MTGPPPAYRTPAYRTVLVGHGEAGGRFLRALRYGNCAQRFDVVALADRDPGRLAPAGSGLRGYVDLELALRTEAPEVAVVCVNEEGHVEALEAVLASPSIRHVVCEKPLTRTLAEFRQLGLEGCGIPVSVNFCERYSPAVQDCSAWLAWHGATVSRVEFGWGKYRVRDPRPTMGVLSELSHPVDLTRCLLGLPPSTPFGLVSAAATYSDFSSFSDRVADGVTIVGDLRGCLVVGGSSFVWEERRRRLVLYAQTAADGRSWMLILDFDNPVWDNDSFLVYELEPAGGRRVQVEGFRYQAADLSADVRHVQKIYRYLLDVADSLAGAPGQRRYADVSDALWVQTTLEDIGTRAHDTAGKAYARLFAVKPEMPRHDSKHPRDWPARVRSDNQCLRVGRGHGSHDRPPL